MRSVVAFALLLPALAWAGAQEREVLTEDVRIRLASAVSHKPVAHLRFKNSEDGQRWIAAMSDKLGGLGLTADQADAVMKLSREVIERVVWEVVPVLAETIIKEELARLTK